MLFKAGCVQIRQRHEGFEPETQILLTQKMQVGGSLAKLTRRSSLRA